MTTDFVTDLDKPLLQLTPKDAFTGRDSFQGVHVFGATGSGKTSGAGKSLSSIYLRAGYGGLVLCAKPEEVELWKSYCKKHGRESSMILFDEKRHFNFLQYEFSRRGADAANSVTDILMKVLKTADVAAGQGQGSEGEKFWQKATRECLLNVITVLFSATGTVRLESIVEFLRSMPGAPPSTEEAKKKLVSNYAFDRLNRCKNKPAHTLPPHTLKRVRDYWFKQFANPAAMPERMRGSIVSSVTAELNRFSDGMLRECFTTTTDIVPEMVFNGAIIIMCFPVLSFQEEGIVAQQLFKLMFQRAVESRNGLAPVFQERPVFLWGDEAQYFVNEYDDTFLSTCRGSKCAVVYLTQSLPTYYAQLGKQASDRVDGFVGKFASKIFFTNADPRTNQYASALIGRGLHLRRSSGESKGSSTSHGRSRGSSSNSGYSSGGGVNSGSSGGSSGGFFSLLPSWNCGRSDGVSRNTNHSGGSGSSSGYSETDGENHSESTSAQEQMDNLIEPNYFAQHLKCGGEPHKFEVTALWLKAGSNFKQPMPNASNNVVLVTFNQR